MVTSLRAIGATTRMAGNAIGQTRKNACSQRETKFASMPVNMAVSTPDINKPIKKDIMTAKTIGVYFLGIFLIMPAEFLMFLFL